MAIARVVVIGGGLAGLGAAKTLCDTGRFEVKLLEADKVLGGRVKNDKLQDGTPVPIGAASFHGRNGNPLYTYAESEGLLDSQEFRIQDDMVLHTYMGGRKVPEKVVEILEDKVEEILDGLEECFDTDDWSQFERVEKVVHQPTGVKVPAVDLHDLIVAETEPLIQQEEHLLKSHDTAAILEGIIAYEGITEGCKGLRGIDPVSLGSWQYLDDDIDFVFKVNPYLKVVNSLASKLSPGVIMVDKEVCSIVWNTDSALPITIQCTDGSTYQADHVIYTCSLGVLKHACSTGSFSPALPPAKVSAIEELAIGLVNKVFIQFDGPLAPNGEYSQFRLYWTEADMNDPIVMANKWVTGLQFIENYNYECQSNRFAYCIFLLGDDALAVESLPEAEVGHVIIHCLGLFLDRSLPELVSVKVTRWSDEFTRGSYSYTPHGVSYDKRKDLATPTGSGSHPLQILFAGEATSFQQFGCAHSAFDTGIREANRLIEHYR